MKKVHWITLIAVTAIVFFFAGFYSGAGSPSSKDIHKNISSLKEENQNLESRLEDFNNSLKSQCKFIDDEIRSYVQNFSKKACSSEKDCAKVSPPTSCGVCVHKSIDSDKVNEYNELFKNLECASNFPDEFYVSCPAVATRCECNDGVCKSTP